jgi:F-type H+-transporting ATPase subunit c
MMLSLIADITLTNTGVIGAFGCIFAASGVTIIGAKAVDGISRNPGASGKILVQSIVGMALAEAIAFYALFFAK